MKILIVGGAGYLGSVLTDVFLSYGHEVTVLDVLRRGSDGIIMHKNNSNFTLINADYISGALLLALQDIDIVIHLAAIVGDPECKKFPELATKTNSDGIRILVRACNKMKIKKLFFASTGSVYGSNFEVCTENTPVNPLSHYAHTKLKAESILKKSSENFLIFRFGTLYGLSPNMRYDLVINRFVRDAIMSGNCNVYDGRQYRGFMHVRDIAYFFMYLFDKDLTEFNKRTYNLVSENLSMLQIGQLITLLLPYALLKLSPDKEDLRTYICSSFKAYSELGFSPKVRIRDGVKEIELAMLRKNNGYIVPINEVNRY